jgi:hypothetical protein
MTRRPGPRALGARSSTIVLLLLVMCQGCAGELDRSYDWPTGSGGAGSGGIGGGGSGGGGVGDGGMSAARGCAEAPGIFTKHSCTACHDASGAFANFDMASPGWETRLVGVRPKGGGKASPSVCASPARDYLVAGSVPATGLFLDKLKPTTTTSCGLQMPSTLDYLSADELTCVQRWADALTAP